MKVIYVYTENAKKELNMKIWNFTLKWLSETAKIQTKIIYKYMNEAKFFIPKLGTWIWTESEWIF